jgi:hypothetical protein
MAYQVEKDPANGGAVKTPNPTKPAEVVNPAARTFGRESYGANGYGGKAYLNPGEQANMGDLSAEIARINKVGDAMATGTGLQQLNGLHTEGAPQTRTISDQGYPTAHGSGRVTARPGEVVPQKSGSK